MAAAVYTTDLATHTLCDSVTGFTEATGFTATDGTGVADTDLAIYGTTCISESQRKSGSGSLFYTGTARTLPTDGAFFVWFKFFAPNALSTKAAGGMQILIGNTDANFRQYYVNGSDTYSYGGWLNYAVDPRITPSTSTGTPNTTYAGVGIGCILGIGISKGNCYTIDHIRYGRGQITFTNGDLANGYATFLGASLINDDPTTGRWGLLQNVGGSFLYKGLLSLGSVATAVDFRDSNRVLTIDNTEFVSSAFNRIEINNAGSNVEWTGINISSLSTVSPGQIEVVANATVVFDTCAFTNMLSFIFQSNTSLVGTTFRNATTVTTGGASIDGCTFQGITNLNLTSSITSCDIIDSDQVDLTVTGAGLTDCIVNRTINATSMVLWDGAKTLSGIEFIGEATNKHAVELTSFVSTVSWNHISDSNFATGTLGVEGVDFTATANGDETLYLNFTSASNIEIAVAGGATIPSVRLGAGVTGTVTISSEPKTIDVTVRDEDGVVVSGAFVWINDGTTTLTNTTTSVGGTITQVSYSGTSDSTLRVRKFGFKPVSTTIATATGNVNQNIQLISDPQQLAVPTLNNAGTIVVNTGTSRVNINGTTVPTHTAYSTMDTAQDLYEYLMNVFAATSFMEFQHPMDSATQRDYSFVNGWTFTQKDIDYKYIYGGTIYDTANNLQWSNVRSIGSLTDESNVQMYVVQGVEGSDGVLTKWYPNGNINILVKVQDGTFIQSTSDLQVATDGAVWIYAREFQQLYDQFFTDLSPGGQTVIALSTSVDGNNQTAIGTVSGYSDITITFGVGGATISRSLNATDFFDYRVEVDCNGRPLSEVYEYLKYVTRRGADSTPLINITDDGYDYRNANESVYQNVDVRVSPFGTFAGGRFFGAQGVFLSNMAGSDSTNYQLIDNTGVTRTPPVTVNFSVTNIQPGTEVRIFTNPGLVELAGRENVGGVADGSDNNFTQSGPNGDGVYSLDYTYVYSADTPVFVVAHSTTFQWLRLSTTLTADDGSLQIAQIPDRQYI